MFRFIAKVWFAGEINDYRRERKRRKFVEKIERKKRQAEIGRNLRNSKELGTYQKGTWIMLASLIGFFVGGVLFPPITLIALIGFITGVTIQLKSVYKANNN